MQVEHRKFFSAIRKKTFFFTTKVVKNTVPGFSEERLGNLHAWRHSVCSLDKTKSKLI